MDVDPFAKKSILPELRARVLAVLDRPECSEVELRVAREALRTIRRIYDAQPERRYDWDEIEEDDGLPLD